VRSSLRAAVTRLASTGDRSWGDVIVSIIGATLSVVGLDTAARLVGSATTVAPVDVSGRLL